MKDAKSTWRIDRTTEDYSAGKWTLHTRTLRESSVWDFSGRHSKGWAAWTSLFTFRGLLSKAPQWNQVNCMKFNSNTIVQLYDSISNIIWTFPQTTAECIGPTFRLCLSPHWNFWLKILRSIYSDVTTCVHENMRMKVTRHWRNLINK